MKYQIQERFVHRDGLDHVEDPPLNTIEALSGKPMDYPDACARMLEVVSQRPELHMPGAITYLTVLPMGGAL